MIRRFPIQFVSLLLIFFSSCKEGSADRKVPRLATEMCDCFETFKKTVDPDELNILKNISSAANPQEELSLAFRMMDEERATAFAIKMKSLGEKNSSVYKCLEAFDQKYGKETTGDKKALTEKLLSELQGLDCTIGAAMVNLGLGKSKSENQ